MNNGVQRGSTVLPPAVSPIRGTLFALLSVSLFLLTPAVSGNEGSSATLVVDDRLCLPGEEIYIEATLYRSGLLGFLKGGLQGELLHFLDPQGNPLGHRLTDTSGFARVPYKAGATGRYPITVRLAENPRYSADPSTGNLFVREEGFPLFFVTVEAGLMPPQSTIFLPKDPREIGPQPGSVEAMSEIGRCHTLVYLTQWSKPSSHQIRSWLEKKGYPPGPVYLLERPLLAGIVGEPPAPETDVLESLWAERSVPAHLATGESSLAKAAAEEEIRVFLIGAGKETPSSVGREEDEGIEGEKAAERVTFVQEWAEIPAICPCKTAENR